MNDLKEICRNYNKKQQAGLLEVGWDNQVGWAKNIIDVQLREAFKNKNDETYGIFHMLVDPPYQHMENSFVIFYCLKRISDSF